MTHYVPMFTRRNGRSQEAVCGAWVRDASHSQEPSCPACQQWLAQDATQTMTQADVEAEAVRLFGAVVPAPGQ